MLKNNYKEVPFIISDNQYKYYIDEDCEFYSIEKSKSKIRNTGGIEVEYCSLPSNISRYNKLGAKMIRCNNCKKGGTNGIQKSDGIDNGKELSVDKKSSDPLADFFRSVD